MYCPECKTEYEEGIMSCARCSVELVKEPDYKETEIKDNLVTIIRIMDREKAVRIEQILKDNKIYCSLNNFKSAAIGNGGSVHTITLPVEVQVLKKDIENAVTIIQQSDIDVYIFAAKINIEQSTDKNMDNIIQKKAKVVGVVLGSYIIIMTAIEIISNIENGFWAALVGLMLLVAAAAALGLLRIIKRSSNNVKKSQQYKA